MPDRPTRRKLPANLSQQTAGVRAGSVFSDLGEHSELPFLTSSFAYRSAAEAAAVFAGEQDGFVYSRYTNPTVQSFEQRLARLEKADFCVATASGMSALLMLALCTLRPGDKVVSSDALFGTSVTMLRNYLPEHLGVECEFVPLADLEAWDKALASGARLALLETPSNPMLEQVELKALSALCRRHGVQLAVDNTLPTPIHLRPFELGADWVWTSATKWLDGQGRCVGGALLGRRENEAAARNCMRVCGLTMGAFDAWVLLKGLETLHARVEAASRTAAEIARWLRRQDGVEALACLSLPDHPGHRLAKEQMDGFGSLISFCLPGGQQGAWRFTDNTALVSITANLGDTRSTLTHPATTTHRSLPEEERARLGIAPGLVRLAVGLESAEDLKADLQRGLEAVTG